MAANKRTMSDLEIASKIRARKTFTAPTGRDRQMVLQAARFLGAKLHTRKTDNGGFTVFFLA